MFDKFREKRAAKKNKDVTELLAWQAATLKEIDEKFVAVETNTDAAEQIVMLKDLRQELRSLGWSADSKKGNVIDKRTKPNMFLAATGSVAGFAASTAAIVVPAAILCPPLIGLAPIGLLGAFAPVLGSDKRKDKKEKKFLAKNPTLGDFDDALEALKTRSEEMLEETVQNCDLKAVSLSPHFGKAFNVSQSLSQRFADAAADAARQDVEKTAAPQQEPVAAPQQQEPIAAPQEQEPVAVAPSSPAPGTYRKTIPKIV